MNDLRHLRGSAFTITEPEMTILIESTGCIEDAILIHARVEDGQQVLEYQAKFHPSSRPELINSLEQAIGVLRQLPDAGTFADLAEAMGTDLASLEI